MDINALAYGRSGVLVDAFETSIVCKKESVSDLIIRLGLVGM